MTMISAPIQLPLVPRPVAHELLSSWLLRTAAANGVSFAELLDGLRLHYPASILPGQNLDYAVPEVTIKALAVFARVPPAKLRRLDLNIRVPHLDTGLLLHFQKDELSFACPRGRPWRVRYAFCPQCLMQQKTLHIRWDWCFVALISCAVHQSILRDTCPHCGIADPLNFSWPEMQQPHPLCRSCFSDLTVPAELRNRGTWKDLICTVETLYRSSLVRAVFPELLNSTTDQTIRNFIEDMLQLLMAVFSFCAGRPGGQGLLSIPRHCLVMVIADLMRNAAPTGDSKQRSVRHRRNLLLWSTLFKIMTEAQGNELERHSLRWPPSLHQLFTIALRHRRRKRHPFSPYPTQVAGLGFKYKTLAAVFDLSTGPGSRASQSQI